MGKHNKQEPKKISLLGSMSGIFIAMLLAIGIFTVVQISGNPFGVPAEKPITTIPEKEIQVQNVPGPTTVPVVPVQLPGVQTPTQVPTISPTPKPSPAMPTVSATVVAPAVDTTVRVDVPLLGQVVQVVDNTVDTAENVIVNITDLLK